METFSKYKCGNLLITEDEKYYLKNGKPAKEIYCGRSTGYYVNRRFRTWYWIRLNRILSRNLIAIENEYPF